MARSKEGWVDGFLKTRQSVAGYSKYAAGAIATHSSGRKNIEAIIFGFKAV